MSKKRVLTVGLELASSETVHADFRSKPSLLDWDIVLFKPEIGRDFRRSDYYRGKPSLSLNESSQVIESCRHWRREIQQTMAAGNTVIAFAPPLEEVYIDTGERSYSGTGRNRQETVQVSKFDNYRSIPGDLSPVRAVGSAMKLAARGAKILAPYWQEFERDSRYQVVFNASKVPPFIVTRSGDKPVGAIYKSKSAAGHLLVLPDIDFYPDHFLKTIESESEYESKAEWTSSAKRFAARMLATVIALDKALHHQGEKTPEPPWATSQQFVLAPEPSLRNKLVEAEEKIEEIQQKREELKEEIGAIGAYRTLLFEKGKPLENAIINALELMGFRAAALQNSKSEFDVVFESDEGRFLGEAEGRDNRAIGITKLRQLSANILEDLEREEVSNPAKPVLFGNAFRLQELASRSDPFTQKCKQAAQTSSTALVFAPDLFFVAKYLLGNDDRNYARKCRQAFLNTVGRVTFPTPPDPASSGEILLDESSSKKVQSAVERPIC